MDCVLKSNVFYVFGLYFQIKSFWLFMDCVLKSPPPCHRLLSLVFPPIRCRREREGGFQTSVIYLHINFFNLPSSRVASCFVSEVNIDPKQKQRKMPSPRWKLQTAPPKKFGQPSFGMVFFCFALFIMQIESVFLCSTLPPSINDAIENTMIGPGSDKNERNKTTKSMITLL